MLAEKMAVIAARKELGESMEIHPLVRPPYLQVRSASGYFEPPFVPSAPKAEAETLDPSSQRPDEIPEPAAAVLPGSTSGTSTQAA